jgi:FKBP-type peptidyl-prolyl cis-trans isomerase
MSRVLAPLSLAFALLALPLFAVEKPAPPADLTAPPADAERTADGLVTKKLADGTGSVKPTSKNFARMRLTVWKPDGTLVQDVSAPRSMLLGIQKMIPGWGEAVQMMVVGEKRRSWIPASLSGGKLKEGESLVIDTELLEIVEIPTTPPDVAAAPDDAVKTASGLAYKVLRAGTGENHPRRHSTVVVHYTGWSTDGNRFDSSVLRDEPATFSLDQVIPGWTEGLQLMVKGEKMRFWIPAKLAYAKDKTRPQGMLVFDIELLDIK